MFRIEREMAALLLLFASTLSQVGCQGSEPSLAAATEALAVPGLYVASNGQLWLRGAIGPGTGNAWTSAGDASNVTAMTVHNGDLYVTSNNALWKLSAFVPGVGNQWLNYGDAYNVTGMASFNGNLYVASNGALWQRGALGPGTGNDWTNVGQASNVTSMAVFNGNLYVTSNGALWQRGAMGPGTGNDWTNVGQASNVTAMAVIPTGNSIPTFNAWPTSPLPNGAQVALRVSRRFNLIVDGVTYPDSSGVSSYGPVWLGLQYPVLPGCGIGPLVTADDTQLVPTDIFTVTVIPNGPTESLINTGPHNYQKILLRAANGNYVGMSDDDWLLLADATSESDAQVFIYDLTIPRGGLYSIVMRYSDLVNGTWGASQYPYGGPMVYGKCFLGPMAFQQNTSGSTIFNLNPFGYQPYNYLADGCYFDLFIKQ